MEIEVKGHSGCDIEVARENGELYIYKSTKDPKYFKRLVLQAEKQQQASRIEMQYIRVPQIHAIKETEKEVIVKMDYVYSRNFVEFFEQAGFEQIGYLIKGLIMFLEKEIEDSPLQTVPKEVIRAKFEDVKQKTLSNPNLQGDAEIENILAESGEIFAHLSDMELPIGTCHGDLTFSNILFNGNNYYLIDFLDSFIESPILDIVKIRQDTAWLWSRLMYTQQCDTVRLKIAFSKIDQELDSYFRKEYGWYDEFYDPLELLNFLRILQYAHDSAVITYLKTVIRQILERLRL